MEPNIDISEIKIDSVSYPNSIERWLDVIMTKYKVQDSVRAVRFVWHANVIQESALNGVSRRFYPYREIKLEIVWQRSLSWQTAAIPKIIEYQRDERRNN